MIIVNLKVFSGVGLSGVGLVIVCISGIRCCFFGVSSRLCLCSYWLIVMWFSNIDVGVVRINGNVIGSD